MSKHAKPNGSNDHPKKRAREDHPEDAGSTHPSGKPRIDEKDHVPVRLSNVKEGLHVDIVAVVLRPHVQFENNKRRFKRCVEVCDDTWQRIRLYLRGEIVENFAFDTYDFISVKNVNVRIATND